MGAGVGHLVCRALGRLQNARGTVIPGARWIQIGAAPLGGDGFAISSTVSALLCVSGR